MNKSAKVFYNHSLARSFVLRLVGSLAEVEGIEELAGRLAGREEAHGGGIGAPVSGRSDGDRDKAVGVVLEERVGSAKAPARLGSGPGGHEVRVPTLGRDVLQIVVVAIQVEGHPVLLEKFPNFRLKLLRPAPEAVRVKRVLERNETK